MTRALLADLTSEDRRELAKQLAPEILAEIVPLVAAALSSTASEKAWLSTREAAAYIGRTPNAIHKLTRAQAIPFHQDGPHGRCYFHRDELDAWMRQQKAA